MIDHIEKEINTISNNFELTDLIKLEVDKGNVEGYKDALNFELLALKFMMEKGGVKPIFVMGDYSHPTYDQLGADGIEYLKERVTITKNNYLAARYNQIIYNHPETKHNKFLTDGISAYLKVISERTSKEVDEDDYELQLILDNFINLGAESKKNHKTFRDEINRLMDLQSLPARQKRGIIELAIEVKSIFKALDLKEYISMWDDLYKEIKEDGDVYWIKTFAETGLLLAQRTQTDERPWHIEIGDCFRADTLQEASSENRMMVAVMHCDSAIRAYKSAGNEVMVEKMRVLRIDLKDKFEMPVIPFEFEIDKEIIFSIKDTARQMQESLFAKSSSDMFADMSQGIGIFPRIDDMMNTAKDRSFLRDLFNTAYYDSNNNKVTGANTDEDKKIKKFYETYNFQVNVFILPVLNDLFFNGVSNEKITYENILGFLKDNTWMGKTRIRKDSSTNWVVMLAPAMNEYFTQLERMKLFPDYEYQPVVLLDSLATKFEGAFRSLCKLHNIVITLETQEGQREKFLHELIYDDKVLEILGQDDVIFFRYLYTKNGLDLRNRIAHSFMILDEYNLNWVHLVIMSFLRLGRYDLVPKV